MHRANIEKIAPPSNATLPSIAPPRDPEKQSLNIAKANSQPSNMPRLQHLCFTLLILALLGLTIVSAASSQQGDANGISDAVAKEKLRFQELLNSVEPSSLHEVLHTHMKDRYKHGVYQEDKHAMEVVHQENAVVAHSLLELAKRQSGNSTVVVTTTASTFTQVTTTATQTSPPVSSDTSLPPKTSQTSQPAAASTTSSPHVQQTSSPVVHSTSSPPVASTNGVLPVSSVSSASPSTSSPSSPSPSPSGSQVKTTTSDQITAAASRSVTQQILYTSTFPNGGVTTVTSLTVVPAEQAQTAGGTSTNTANASLQTNSAKSVKALSINGVLAALGLILVFGA